MTWQGASGVSSQEPTYSEPGRPNGGGVAQRNLTGYRSGRLIVICRASEPSTMGRSLWRCLCDCGKTKIARADTLLRKHTRSCGCWRNEIGAKNLLNCVHKNHKAPKVWAELLDAICEVCTRFPAPPREIHRDLESNWGPCQPRRFWRALSTLVKQGRLDRTGIPQSSIEEIGSMYRLGVPWWANLASCLSEAAATYAVLDLGLRRGAQSSSLRTR